MNNQRYVNTLRNGHTPELLQKIVDDHKDTYRRTRDLYERYKGKSVPIFRRSLCNAPAIDFERGGSAHRIDNIVDNRLAVPFDANIIDTKVGYMYGVPIQYDVASTSQTNLDRLKNLIIEFNTRNNSEDKDSELGKKAAICGYAARMVYTNTRGEFSMINLDPWETIIISAEDITQPEFAIRYFILDDNGTLEVEFYDDRNYYVYRSGNANGKLQLVEKGLHTFNYCPLFGLPNNEELLGDAERVLNLIDAFNRTLSDASNEIEQYRLAYLVVRGMMADENMGNTLNSGGIFELLGEKDDVKYLTKDVNNQMIEDHLNRLKELILSEAKSVDFTDESFGQSISGVALQFKLTSLENKCKTMERKFSAMLRYQFKVLCSAWAKKGMCKANDYLNVWFEFKRNIPVNQLEQMQIAVLKNGFTSLRTALGSVPGVDDVDYELEQLDLERNDIEPLFGQPGEQVEGEVDTLDNNLQNS